MLKRKFLKVFSIVTILVVIFSFILSVPGSAVSEMLVAINYNYFYSNGTQAPIEVLPFVKTKMSVDNDQVLLPNVNSYALHDAFDPDNHNWDNRTEFVFAQASNGNAIGSGVKKKTVLYTQTFGKYSAASYTVQYLTCVDQARIYFDTYDSTQTSNTSSLSGKNYNAKTNFSVFGGAAKIPAGLSIKENNYRFYFNSNLVSGQSSCSINISYDIYQFDTVYDAIQDKAITKLVWIGSVVDDSRSVAPGQVVRIFENTPILNAVNYNYNPNKDIFIDNVVLDVEAEASGVFYNNAYDSDRSNWLYEFQFLTPITLSGYDETDVFYGGYEAFYDSPAEIEPIVTVDFEDISLVDWFVTQVNSAMKLEIIPNFYLGGIVWFCVGLGMFFFVLKTFLGG